MLLKNDLAFQTNELFLATRFTDPYVRKLRIDKSLSVFSINLLGGNQSEDTASLLDIQSICHKHWNVLTLKRPAGASEAQVPIQNYLYPSVFIRST